LLIRASRSTWALSPSAPHPRTSCLHLSIHLPHSSPPHFETLHPHCWFLPLQAQLVTLSFFFSIHKKKKNHTQTTHPLHFSCAPLAASVLSGAFFFFFFCSTGV
jgi:hypothetical protein